LNPAASDEIKRQALAICIRERVSNSNIVTTATRAAWLGNDEVHYQRKWEDKDVQDLKRFIALTVHWIQMEELTKKAAEDMPSPS